MATAVAPQIAIDGPLPDAPPFGLLGVARPVAPDTDRFLGGAAVWPFPTAMPEVWASCSAGTFRLKSSGEEQDSPVFLPFTVIQPVTCSALSVAGGWEAFKGRALQVLDITESWAVEREFLSGALLGVDQPFLANGDAVLIDAGAAKSPREALSQLERAIARTGRAGVIHADPATVAWWSTLGTGLRVEGGKLKTTGNGTPVVAGGGYIDALPADDQGALSDTQGWAFASGPVQYRADRPYVTPDSIAEALDRDTNPNELTAYAERNYLLTWDPAQIQTGVLVDRSLTP